MEPVGVTASCLNNRKPYPFLEIEDLESVVFAVDSMFARDLDLIGLRNLSRGV